MTERRVGLVHTHGLWSELSVSALRWRRRSGGATVVSPHGMLDPWALRQDGFKQLKKQLALLTVERPHMNGSACVHALNRAEHDAIRAAGISAPVAIIPNGITLNPAQPEQAPNWMDRPTLLFLGRLHVKKGINELIDAWSEAHKDLPGWQLALAGWDDGPNDFRERAARSGAPIVFPGPLFDADKAAAYAHCAGFVLPSFSEGLPMTVLEAWSHGKPVLMTEACNLPEGFAAGAALRIETDPRRMAAALVAGLSDAPLLGRTGQAGLALVAQKFSWEAVAARFEALYAYILGRAERPADLLEDEAAGHV